MSTKKTEKLFSMSTVKLLLNTYWKKPLQKKAKRCGPVSMPTSNWRKVCINTFRNKSSTPMMTSYALYKTDMYIKTKTTLERFESLIHFGLDGCWYWIGHVNKKCGYGKFSVSAGKAKLAHRCSYQ